MRADTVSALRKVGIEWRRGFEGHGGVMAASQLSPCGQEAFEVALRGLPDERYPRSLAAHVRLRAIRSGASFLWTPAEGVYTILECGGEAAQVFRIQMIWPRRRGHGRWKLVILGGSSDFRFCTLLARANGVHAWIEPF